MKGTASASVSRDLLVFCNERGDRLSKLGFCRLSLKVYLLSQLVVMVLCNQMLCYV